MEPRTRTPNRSTHRTRNQLRTTLSRRTTILSNNTTTKDHITMGECFTEEIAIYLKLHGVGYAFFLLINVLGTAFDEKLNVTRTSIYKIMKALYAY